MQRSLPKEIISRCFLAMSDNDIWQEFGFKKYPKFGRLIQKIRPKWKVKLEKKILCQILACLVASYIRQNKIDTQTAIALVDDVLIKADVPEAFGFLNRDECVTGINVLINKYSTTVPNEWPFVMAKNLELDLIQNKNLVGRLILGTAVFPNYVGTKTLFE